MINVGEKKTSQRSRVINYIVKCTLNLNSNKNNFLTFSNNRNLGYSEGAKNKVEEEKGKRNRKKKGKFLFGLSKKKRTINPSYLKCLIQVYTTYIFCMVSENLD